MSPRERDGGGAEEAVVDLWTMAADLERQFSRYKQRLADRTSHAEPDEFDDADAHHGCGNDVGGEDGGGGGEEVRGRMYEAYTRTRDELLREGWRARMERKEAEVKALWAQLERRGGVGDTTADGAAGEKVGDDDGDRRRSSDVSAAPASRISGKKPGRTKSFSSSTTKSNRPDAVGRRALSHEPPPPPPPSTSEAPPAAASRRVARVTGGAGSKIADKRRVFSAARERGSTAKGGTKPKPKPPRILSNTCSAAAAPAVQSCSSSELATTVHDKTEKASSLPAPFAAVSPDSDCGEIVEVGSGTDDHHDQAGDEAKEHNAEEVTVSPLTANGEITSDSDTELSYVYVVKKDVVVVVDDEDAAAMARRSEALAGGSDSKPDLKVEKNNSNESDADVVVAESATTIAEEAPARESSDEPSTTSFSVTSGTPASCISRAPSIERLLVEDAALLRKKRQEIAAAVAEKRALTPPPPPARVSGGGAGRSPREAVRGFKRFLSFGKKNRGGGGREVTVIDCTSPSVPSVADDDSGSGGWQSTDTIKPRMASSDAASDDMDHGHAVSSPHACSLQSLVAASPAKSELNEIDPQEKSPKAHRSFFSFRSFNCGRS